MEVNKIEIRNKQGQLVGVPLNLTEDTAVANDVAQGKTFHLSTGVAAEGTSTGGGGEEYYTVILDCKFMPNIGAYPLAPGYTGEGYDYSYIAAISGSGRVLKIPASCVFQCGWDNLRNSNISYNVYVNNILQPTSMSNLDVAFRGEVGETYTIRMVVQWEEMEQPVQISAADCKFDDQGTLLSYIFSDAYNAPTNIILPSSYNMTSQSSNIDCRTNDITGVWSLESYISSNHISFPITLTNGRGESITVNSRNDLYNWEINEFFQQSKLTIGENLRGEEQYTISGTTITTVWDTFELSGTLNTQGSTITNSKYTFYYDTNDTHYRPDPSEWPDGESYTFNTVEDLCGWYGYDMVEDPNWTITLSYTESTFSDGNDYQVTSIGSGSYSIFEEAEPGYPVYSKRVRRVVIPNGVTEINYGAFSGCGFIREYSLPSGLTNMGSLSGCYETLVIPNTVTSIDKLYGCLTSLTIPSSVQYFGSIESWTLSSITLIQGSLLYQSQMFNIVRCCNLETISGLANTAITDWSDGYGNYSLKRIDSQTDGVFDIHNIENISIPLFEDCAEHVEQIILGKLQYASNAFTKCYKLREIVFPDTLNQIADIEVSTGGNVETLTFQSDDPPQLENAEPLFNGAPSAAINLTTIYVPQLSVQAYKEATNWTVYADLIEGDPNNPGHGPTPPPEPVGEPTYTLIDTTSGSEYDLPQFNGTIYRNEIWLEAGHNYMFGVYIPNQEAQEGLPNAITYKQFPNADESTYIINNGNGLNALSWFKCRVSLNTNGIDNLENMSVTIRYLEE